MEDFLLQNWEKILMILGAIIGWIYKRPIGMWMVKQSKADVKSTQASTDNTTIDNLKKTMNIYVSMIDDIEKRYEKKLDEANLEIKILRNEIDDLRSKLKKYMNE